MQDPPAENIAGEKRVAHTVEHRINWGYVALAAAAIGVLLYLRPSSDDGHPDPTGKRLYGVSENDSPSTQNT